MRKSSLIIDQSWIEDWQKGYPSQEQMKHVTGWIKTVPGHRRPVLLSFPPMCLIRPKKPLDVPYPGTFAFVVSYEPDGRLGVRQEPNADTTLVSPEDVIVAGYWRNFGPALLLHVLAAQQLNQPQL